MGGAGTIALPPARLRSNGHNFLEKEGRFQMFIPPCCGGCVAVSGGDEVAGGDAEEIKRLIGFVSRDGQPIMKLGHSAQIAHASLMLSISSPFNNFGATSKKLAQCLTSALQAIGTSCSRRYSHCV
jgi:hypothetical protein